MKKALGIDFGTAFTRVYMKESGIIIDEPSVVTVDLETDSAVSFGMEAKEMIGRTPEHMRTIMPVSKGSVTDFEYARELLRHYLKSTGEFSLFSRPELLFALPDELTEIEKKALIEVILQAGSSERSLFFIEKPVAAALGAGIDIMEPAGSLIVDIGAGCTQIAAISLGGIVESGSIRVGSKDMDDAICAYLKKISNMSIGESTAEDIKLAIGCAYVDDRTEERSVPVAGISITSGLPESMELTNYHVAEAVYPTAMAIVNAICEVLEKLPPEVSADILASGITLAGGGALMGGLDLLIQNTTGIKTRIAEDPEDCVINGVGMVLERPDEFRSLITSALSLR